MFLLEILTPEKLSLKSKYPDPTKWKKEVFMPPSRDSHSKETFSGVELWTPPKGRKTMSVLFPKILTPESPYPEAKSPDPAKYKKVMFVLPPEILTPDSPFLESKSLDPAE